MPIKHDIVVLIAKNEIQAREWARRHLLFPNDAVYVPIDGYRVLAGLMDPVVVYLPGAFYRTDFRELMMYLRVLQRSPYPPDHES